MILLLFSFLAGFITALSPCSLPILPILLGASTSRVRPLAIILGLVLSFTFFTLLLGKIVQAFGISPDLLRMVAVAVIGLFGLVLLFPALSDWFGRATAPLVTIGEKGRIQSEKWGKGWFGGLLLGASLGLLWTPCAGPILAAVISLAATQTVTSKLFAVTLSYSLGAALPMLLILYGGRSLLPKSRYAEEIRKLFGLLMLLTALAMFYGADLTLQEWASQYVPSLVLEDQPVVKEQLASLKKPGSQNLELVGITGWVNSPPLTLKELRGKVVLVDFWTYSCINCIRTFPYLKEWDAQYRNQGLLIIGVHTPEFAFEKRLENVQEAVKRFQIHYPVALDSNYQTWEAFQNAYWPAHYLFDQQGILRQVHFGEGSYVETENAIRTLLGLPSLAKKEPEGTAHLLQTEETYLGYGRALHYSPEMGLKRDATQFYTSKEPPGPDQVVLRGSWLVGPESITAEGADSLLEINFQATHVYLVMEGAHLGPVEVLLDGQPLPKAYFTADINEKGQILLDQPRKYDLLDLKGKFERHRLILHLPKGASAYAFTFG